MPTKLEYVGIPSKELLVKRLGEAEKIYSEWASRGKKGSKRFDEMALTARTSREFIMSNGISIPFTLNELYRYFKSRGIKTARPVLRIHINGIQKLIKSPYIRQF